RHEENAVKLATAARDLPIGTAAALLASAEGYTPRANHHLEAAREELGTIAEVANALADDLPAPKAHPGRRRRRRRKKKPTAAAQAQGGPEQTGAEPRTAAPADENADVKDAVTTGQASASE